MAIGTIPPWLNVSPSDFLRAMQAGAGAGLQVAQLRQSGRLEENRLAQAAAQAAAARADAAAARQAAMDFDQWQQQERGRQLAAELAQRERIATAQLGQSALDKAAQRELSEANLRLGEMRLGAQQEHWRELDKAQADKIKAQLNLPTKLHINVVGRNLVATDPTTGDYRVLFTAPEIPPRPGSTRISGLPVNKEFPEEFGTVSGPLTDPFILQRLGTNAPSLGIPGAIPAPRETGVRRYIFNPETGRLEPKE